MNFTEIELTDEQLEMVSGGTGNTHWQQEQREREEQEEQQRRQHHGHWGWSHGRRQWFWDR